MFVLLGRAGVGQGTDYCLAQASLLDALEHPSTSVSLAPNSRPGWVEGSSCSPR